MATIRCRWRIAVQSQALGEKVELLEPQKTIVRIKAFHDAVVAAETPRDRPSKKPTLPLSEYQDSSQNSKPSHPQKRMAWSLHRRSTSYRRRKTGAGHFSKKLNSVTIHASYGECSTPLVIDYSPPTQPYEALLVNSKLLHSDRQKHYAKQCNWSSPKRKDTNGQSKKLLNATTVIDESSQGFTEAELKRGIRRMRPTGTAGPDEITTAFVLAARTELLAIFNRSWNGSVCPQVRRNATIIPLLKQASEMSSFRPTSLTSCIAKLMERLIATRLMHIVKSSKLLSNVQRGDRKSRCCETRS